MASFTPTRSQFYLTPAQKPPPRSRPQPAQTQLDRIVATGRVVITQPGRSGSGEKLVYTADDGKYILTGTPGNPPRIVRPIERNHYWGYIDFQ